MSSCNESQLVAPCEIDNSQYNDVQKLEKVFKDLEALNSAYPSETSRGWKPKWPNIPRDYADLADMLGQKCGTVVGRWTGAAIGSSVAGPAGACIGHVWGGVAGGYIGYVAASAAAKRYFDCAGLAVKDPNYRFIFDNNIQVACVISDWADTEMRAINDDMIAVFSAPNTDGFIDEGLDNEPGWGYIPSILNNVERCDSLGYYHNNMMVTFENESDKYIKNGEPDIEKIYNYVASYIVDTNFDINRISEDIELKNKVIEFCKDIANMAMSSYYSGEDYIDLQCTYMKNMGFSEEEIFVYKNFDVEIAYKCTQLSEEQIHNYAAELNTIILNSDVTPKQKADLAIGAQAAINSVLFWNQFE